MRLNRFEIEILYHQPIVEKGKQIKKQYSTKVLGVNQKIFQSRIDSQTSYTTQLTHRFIITADIRSDLFDNPDQAPYTLDSAIVSYPHSKIKYAILDLEHVSYNEYILELGEVQL